MNECAKLTVSNKDTFKLGCFTVGLFFVSLDAHRWARACREGTRLHHCRRDDPGYLYRGSFYFQASWVVQPLKLAYHSI